MAAVEELTVALRRRGLSDGRLVKVRDGSRHKLYVAVRNSGDSTSAGSAEESEEYVPDVHPEKVPKVSSLTVRIPVKEHVPATFKTGLPLSSKRTLSGQNISRETTFYANSPAVKQVNTRTLPRETVFVSVNEAEAPGHNVESVSKTLEPEKLCHGRPRPNSEPIFSLRAADSPYNNQFLYVCQEPAGTFCLKMGHVDPREEGAGLFRCQRQMRESDMNMVYAFTNLKSSLTMGVHPGASGAVVTLMSPPGSPLQDSDPRVFVRVPYQGRRDAFQLQATVGKGLYIAYEDAGNMTASSRGSPFTAGEGTPVCTSESDV
ncbi:uncharacterized protein [Littorina saxatilis]|uniref:uncharacterized protein n=1 Tax=Littorina saxatilis TaxID=31220 RepID=UPI0038B6A316